MENLVWFKKNVFDNAEVISTMAALVTLLIKPRQPRFLRPVILYLILALIMYSLGNIMVDHHEWLPTWYYEKLLLKNTPLYSIHSIVRFSCFAYFFQILGQPHYKTIRKILPYISILFFVVNFGILKVEFFDYTLISSRLLTVEAFLLLVYCMLYYLSSLKEDLPDLRKQKDFLVVTGLSFYVVINFFVFLFYANLNGDLQERIWDVHNIAQIIFCIFIVKAFYVPAKSWWYYN